MYSYELFQTELLNFFMQLSRAEAITWESGKVQSGILTVQMKDLATLEWNFTCNWRKEFMKSL